MSCINTASTLLSPTRCYSVPLHTGNLVSSLVCIPLPSPCQKKCHFCASAISHSPEYMFLFLDLSHCKARLENEPPLARTNQSS